MAAAARGGACLAILASLAALASAVAAVRGHEQMPSLGSAAAHRRLQQASSAVWATVDIQLGSGSGTPSYSSSGGGGLALGIIILIAFGAALALIVAGVVVVVVRRHRAKKRKLAATGELFDADLGDGNTAPKPEPVVLDDDSSDTGPTVQVELFEAVAEAADGSAAAATAAEGGTAAATAATTTAEAV
ncbi:cytochrome BD oxidase subunit I [Chlorella sorokiniana]|uniref:Cytochrome BD oxidase subunit I n=1 Tax=Chlorella sorokiniana TaxID=3076 RepID=A0A2P6TQ24_CHLSO|nr:cytochrome BD oxidase subunit I [Chlorella sorokiniana]|eukprot:PRW56136.1 cytochrome BD oxidase subunit I [Chlorella sorokiniana]